MSWKCTEGHTWESCFDNIRNGKGWCPTCGGSKKLTLEDCQKFAKNKNGKCLSAEYVNCKTQMIWECAEGHTWKSRFDNIKSNYWCPACGGSKKLTLEDCQKIAEKKEWKMPKY